MYNKMETHRKNQVAQTHFIIKQQINRKKINKLRQKKKKTKKNKDLLRNLHLLLQIIQKNQNKILRLMMSNNHLHHQVHHQDNQLTIKKKKKEMQIKKEKIRAKIKRKKNRVAQTLLKQVHPELQVLHQDYLLHPVLLQAVLLKKKLDEIGDKNIF